ncbi:phage tail tip lysozyme [Brevibacterium zhoupengii]|uniref:phage tail tip lysozyme n=1 Tax=Brevibacterium zhoupengii TaxID=2898795 RepID=UPI001E364682|nr:phage tail tip lysozyme [Brevibacterium zhoupengii]
MFSLKSLLPGAATIGAGFLALVIIVPVLFGLMAASGACTPVSDDGNGGGDVGDIGDIDPTEKAHARAVFTVLSDKGMSNTNIAGILGNWSQESGVDPTSVQGIMDSPYKMTPKKREKAESFSGGLGLGQWTGSRNSKLKAYAKKKNTDWWTIELQMNFMADTKGDDAQSVKVFEDMIKNELDSVSAATTHFHDKWEKAGAPNMPNRIKQAEKWFKLMKDWKSGDKAQAAGSTPEQGQSIAGGTVTAQKKKKLPLGDVKPHVQEAAEVIYDEYDGITGVGGYRSGSTSRDPNGHPAGLAVDFMVPLNKDGKALGDDIAKFVIDNHKALNVKYVIWYQRIYNVERADEGWRKMPDRGGDTQNHKDHPHVSFQAVPKGNPKDAAGKGGKGGGSDDSDDGNADNISCDADEKGGSGGDDDVPDDGRKNPGAWGGHKNGEIPTDKLKKIPWTPDSKKEYLRTDATEALIAMNKAYKKEFKTDIAITDAYRDLAEQKVLYKRYGPGRAAVPGKSNHGWALAVDYGGGINKFGSPQHKWMQKNAKKFGWEHPPWAREGQKNQEAWHWEYYGKNKETEA